MVWEVLMKFALHISVALFLSLLTVDQVSAKLGALGVLEVLRQDFEAISDASDTGQQYQIATAAIQMIAMTRLSDSFKRQSHRVVDEQDSFDKANLHGNPSSEVSKAPYQSFGFAAEAATKFQKTRYTEWFLKAALLKVDVNDILEKAAFLPEITNSLRGRNHLEACRQLWALTTRVTERKSEYAINPYFDNLDPTITGGGDFRAFYNKLSTSRIWPPCYDHQGKSPTQELERKTEYQRQEIDEGLAPRQDVERTHSLLDTQRIAWAKTSLEREEWVLEAKEQKRHPTAESKAEVDDIEDILHEIEIRDAAIGNNVQQAIIVLGTTGDGKSTLVNYLSDEPLVVKQDEIRGYYIDTDNPEAKIKIGHAGATTTLPNRWTNATSGVTYFDCPGLEDTRGAKQDILNAFSINRALEVSQTVKILLVLSERSVACRGISCRNSFDKLGSLFQNQEDLLKSLACVFTKQRDMQNLREGLRNIDLPDTPNGKNILRFLMSSASRISTFPHPSSFSRVPLPARASVPEDYQRNILRDIQAAEYITHPAINITVSNSSLLTVARIAQRLDDEMRLHILETITPQITIHCDNIFSTNNSVNFLKSAFIQLANRLHGIRQDSPANFLQDIAHILHESPAIAGMEKKIGHMNFLKKINRDIRYTISNWHHALTNSIQSVRALASPRENIEKRRGQQIGSNERVVREWYEDVGFLGMRKSRRQEWARDTQYAVENRLVALFANGRVVYEPWTQAAPETESVFIGQK